MVVQEGDKNLSSEENKGENKVRGLSIEPSAVLFAWVCAAARHAATGRIPLTCG